MITREQAHQMVTEMLPNKNLVKHCLAVEAIMRALCDYLREREKMDSGFHGNDSLLDEEFSKEEWGLVGLLHDADYEVTNKDLQTHTDIIVQKLREMEVPERLVQGILAHHPLKRETRDNYMEKSIFAADELSGLITACALVKPDKKLSSLTVESVMKKFKEKSFAAGALRAQILTCEPELGIPLYEFVAISLKAMQNISDELGL